MPSESFFVKAEKLGAELIRQSPHSLQALFLRQGDRIIVQSASEALLDLISFDPFLFLDVREADALCLAVCSKTSKVLSGVVELKLFQIAKLGGQRLTVVEFLNGDGQLSERRRFEQTAFVGQEFWRLASASFRQPPEDDQTIKE